MKGRRSRVWAVRARGLLALLSAAVSWQVSAAMLPQPQGTDSRIRVAAYDAAQVYSLRGVVGYQIDLQFDRDEVFVGLAAGDIEGLSFVAQGNHLFLKPRAASVLTNLTVLTSSRQYQFEYEASLPGAAVAQRDVMYVVRFTYPAVPGVSAQPGLAQRFAAGAAARSRNLDYWACGSDALRPHAAWDDGVQTHLDFGPRAEMPAIFIRNDDGSESLLNFSIEGGEVVIHRVAHRLVLRRGALTACLFNKGYEGSGERLPSGTLAPQVERVRKGDNHDAAE